MDVVTEVQKIISANLGVPLASVQPESKAVDFSNWDSIQHLLLVMEIEERFGFKFALEEIAGLDSVGNIMMAVQKRVAA
jgi:acyl carrier protein